MVIRSTAEITVAGLPKPRIWTKDFDVGVEALIEPPTDILLHDAPKPGFFFQRHSLRINVSARLSESSHPLHLFI